MQIFELYFNPKIKEDYFSNSFVYEPENVYEKKLGNLYIVSELKNALPQNSRFLNNLTNAVKERYYTISFNAPERAISEGLKKANEFLAGEVKKENVSWLGNLNFALLSINSTKKTVFSSGVKDYDLIFTKTGDIKILLIRGGQIIDIGKNLDIQEINPYPLKIFFNIVSGKLIINDVILVVTKNIYDFFLRQNIIKKITQYEALDEKIMKEIFPQSFFIKKESAEISGICFLAILDQKTLIEKKHKEIFFQEENKYLFTQFLKRPLQLIKKLFSFFKRPTKIIKKLKKRKKIQNKKNPVKKTKSKNSIFPNLEKIIKNPKIIGKLSLILFLVFLLFLGFIIF